MHVGSLKTRVMGPLRLSFLLMILQVGTHKHVFLLVVQIKGREAAESAHLSLHTTKFSTSTHTRSLL